MLVSVPMPPIWRPITTPVVPPCSKRARTLRTMRPLASLPSVHPPWTLPPPSSLPLHKSTPNLHKSTPKCSLLMLMFPLWVPLSVTPQLYRILLPILMPTQLSPIPADWVFPLTPPKGASKPQERQSTL